MGIRPTLGGGMVAGCIGLWAALAGAQPMQLSQLADLPLEALANVQVFSVSRRAESVLEAPASIYVITGEVIRRAGVTSLAEALRLAPNLQVARVDAGQYAISARGFNNTISNKLLVLIDGRTVYTPLFSGVFWDQQDVMLEDIDRIEVISGPGATLYGANAVNGVINVVTRAAARTQGALVSAGVGNREHAAAARFGAELGGGHYRVYAKASRREDSQRADGTPALDIRRHVQTGFRADWSGAADRFTLQGDLYAGSGQDYGTLGAVHLGQHEAGGGNLLGRWTRMLESGGELRLRTYLDHATREDRVLFNAEADTLDVELQHGIPWGAHRLLWGTGYRHYRDKVADAVLAGMRPMHRQLDSYHAFLQAELRVAQGFELTPGLKVEHNDYSGAEYLPSLRLAWTLPAERLVWAAASRAVRAPARLDRDIVLPAFSPVWEVGGRHFDSEVADVYEIGYRARAGRAVTYSATLFRHEWDRLRSAQILGLAGRPFELRNDIEGDVTGFEGWAEWQVTRGWRLTGGLTTLHKDLRLDAGSNDPQGPDNVTLGNDPEWQWSLRSSADLGERQELDIMLRRVAALRVTGHEVDQYTAIDLRYGWKVRSDTEISLTLQNLQERWHPEFRTSRSQPPSEMERSIFLAVRWED